MVKKKSNGIGKTLSWVIPSILTLALIIIIILFVTGVWTFPSFPGQQFGGLNLIELFDREPDTECTFVLDDDEVCLWDNVTGTIRANSPNCYIGYNYNNEGWRFAGIIDEVSPKFYKESRQATAIGNYKFASICGTPTDFCRTNDVEVDVILCDDDGNGCDYTCGWVGEQCGGTCPDSHPLCVDMWFEQNVLWMDGGYSFCACIDPDTETVHPDWKIDGQCHDDSGGLDGLICFDDDIEQDIYFKGTCTPTTGIAEPDFCPTDSAVTQMWCSEDRMSCMGASYPCPSGICIDGACTVEYEYQDNIDSSEAIPGLTYGEDDMDGCISDNDCLQMCQMFVDSEVDSAYCEEFSQRMIDCSEGWNNCGGGEGEGDWYCCFFDDCDSYLQGPCCDGSPTCTCVCERWYISGY